MEIIFKQFGEWGISLKSNNKIMVNSRIRHKIAIIIVLILAGTILLCWLLNTCLSGFVYRNEKIRAMENVFKSLEYACDNRMLYEEDYDISIEQMTLDNNLEIVVASQDGGIILSSSREKINTLRRIKESLLNDNKGEVLVSKENYVVRIVEDSFINGEFLVLSGMLSDGNHVMIRYAMENINATVQIADRFLFVVGVVSVFFAVLIAEIFATKLTRPIVELTDISKRMTEFDFKAKFNSNNRRKNEIDVLGEHMNIMSETLEDALGELKQANFELKNDIKTKEKNEKLRKEFLSNVSHELKTPIALIQGYSEGLLEGMCEDEESRAYYCEVISDEAKKMNKLVQQLMSLNKLECGKDVISIEEFDISEMIKSVVDFSEILTKQKGIHVELDIKFELMVHGDVMLIEQVISNYFSNAIHYCSKDNEILITNEEYDDKVRILFYNSGDNIPEQEINRIWDKFYKVDKARTREYGGSGVGLSIVKAAIEAHKNQYGVYNTNDGVVFWFEIDK